MVYIYTYFTVHFTVGDMYWGFSQQFLQWRRRGKHFIIWKRITPQIASLPIPGPSQELPKHSSSPNIFPISTHAVFRKR